MSAGSVDTLHDEIFYHKVNNYADDIAVSMHLYSPIRERRKFLIEPSASALNKVNWPENLIDD